MTGPRLSATVLDARDPYALAEFYAQLLGWSVAVPGTASGEARDETWVMLRAPHGGAGLSFQLDPLHVAPTWPAQEGAEQMQMHLDIAVDELEPSVQRAIGLGASVALVQPQADVRVLVDPEGHPFCLFVA